ncbi:uncharacterized protein LOC121902080 isoform X6 [Thunnus maccoyii]|uniref:uncharacterized protein LOC121895413 isoform X6 n=1 Tax=Thunnus maccoyii TaxID=8240 RepID=UPI001C4CA19E|nr:uncharacterized protein LOC121895413 isoform X6 [Thunnus maccoyii]XP_042270860.1 uncharacterized protein LOC121899235 isoform X6 [Thunnus maccoyii]XP_042275199.1 uncharacterized protein LOC121902080 isoform X6 [Thunnus maccoyii]
MDPRHKVQTGPPNHWRRRAEPWQVTGWLLLFSLLFSRFGQGTGQVGPNERETGVSLIPGEGERKGFPSHDTVGAMNPVPHGQGRPLQNDPENADQEPDLGHTDKSMSPLGLYNTLLFLEVDGGGLHMIKPKPSENQVCVPQPYTTTAMAEALVYVQPWAGTLSIGPVKIQLRNCSAPQQNEQRPQRDCSTYLPPVFTHELQNVSLCFRGIGKGHEDLGQSSCNTVVDVTLKQSPLPERVYLVCGDRAYRCVPYEDSRGVCYLAYLIPLIREVESTEIASLYPPLHIYKREISSTQKVASFLLPWYGVYVSQQELSSLSKVLENHLNASSRAMLAEHKELQEVKTVALQNRMALDLLLAAQGGTCKLIGSECCSYISDATADVMDMAHDTALGIKELHDSHGFNLGDFSGVFGSWGSGLVRFLTTLAVAVFLFILLCSCVGLIIKLVVKKTTGSVLQAAQVHVTGNTADHNHTGLRYYDFETFQDWMRRFHPEDHSRRMDSTSPCIVCASNLSMVMALYCTQSAWVEDFTL